MWGGWDVLIAAQPVENTSLFAIGKIGFLPAVSLAVVVMVGILATPSYRQRIYSGKTVNTVRKSFYLAGVLYLFFSLIPAIIGMSAYALNSSLIQESFAFPYLALEVLPLSVGIIVLIAGLSATMSSASSDAIAAVVILLRDVVIIFTGRVPQQKHMVFLSRISLVIIIGFALVLAMSSDNIITYITKMISTVMSGLFSCAILGRFWPRFNWQGALASLIGGSVTSLTIIVNDSAMAFWGNPILPSVMLSLGLGFFISKLTPACPITPERALNILNEERARMEAPRQKKPV